MVDKGTAVAVRQRYGIPADVAGTTGTTQGNADGWFILMHPEIVTGAWAGFNDARITLRSDRWGQGSRSALPMVGDFMSRALRSPVIDAKARFEPPEQSHWWSDMVGRLRDNVDFRVLQQTHEARTDHLVVVGYQYSHAHDVYRMFSGSVICP